MPKKSCDYSLHRDRGQVVPQWHKTASKFHRIRCTKCFTSPENQKEGIPHLKVVCLPGSCIKCCCHGPSKAAAKKEVSGSSKQLHLKDQNTGIPGTAGVAGHSTRLVNRKADCCPLLKRITKLKCVNSEFKTVNTHPEKGCLNWLHGTMSEPPWKSH